MVVHVRVLLCTQRYTQRRLTTYECLQFINLPSFNNLTGQGIPNKTLPTSSKLVTYNARIEGDLLVKQFGCPFKGMPSIGTPILSLNSLTVGSKWKESF